MEDWFTYLQARSAGAEVPSSLVKAERKKREEVKKY